jgi:hypothetical protein
MSCCHATHDTAYRELVVLAVAPAQKFKHDRVDWSQRLRVQILA